MGDITFRIRVKEGEASKAIIANIRKEVEQLQASTAGVGRSTAQSTAALKGVQAAANQAAEGYRRVRTMAEEVAEVNRLLPASLKQSSAGVADAGRELAEVYTRELKRAYELAQADTKEALARGLISPEEAMERGRAAGRSFNTGILSVIEGQANRGGLSGRQGQDVFVGLTSQLKNLDGAANKASIGGLRNLSRNFATMATQQLAFRSGLGSIISTLGFLSIGAALTLGVTAGLAAIAFGIRKIRQAAEEAEAPVKALKDRVEELRQARLAPFQTLGEETDAETQFNNQKEELARIQKELRDARRGVSFATDLPGEQVSAQAEINRLLEEEIAAKAVLDEREIRLNDIRRQAGVEATVRRSDEIGAIARLIDAGVASNAQLERRQVLLRDLQAELKQLEIQEAEIQAGQRGTDAERQTRVTRIADVTDQINTLLEAGVKKEKEVVRLNREQLDIELARLQLRSIALQTQVASREISAPAALQEEIKLLEERRLVLARSIPLLEAQAALLKTPEARAGVASVRQELAQTDLQIAELTDETREWQRALEDLEFAHIQEQLLLTNPAEAIGEAFRRSYGAIREAAEKAGETASVALWDKILTRKMTAAEAERILTSLEQDLASLARGREGIQLDLELGRISRPEALERTVQLLEEQRDRIRETLPALREMVEKLQSPELRAELENRVLQLAEIDLQILRLRDTTAEWREQIERIGTSAFAGFLDDLVIQSETVTEAFRNMARAVIQEIARMVAQALAARVALGVFGLLGFANPVAGVAAGVAALAGGFASGGLVRGPGTGTSDSISARLSAGEYVVRASAVRLPGIKELLDAINQGTGPLRLRSRHSPMRFAEGGLVERPRGGSELSGRLDIGLDDGLVLRSMESNEGLRAFLRVVGNNRRAFQRVLG